MRRRKKKGATLIVVIIIFMFVCSVSMALLSMAAANYRARISESQRVENLYSSESGIDIAYNITGKTIVAGIKYGYYQVSELRSGRGSNENKGHCKELNDDISELTQTIKEDEGKRKTMEKEEDKRALDDEIESCKNGIDTDNNTLIKLYEEEFRMAFECYIKEEENVNNDGIKNNYTNALKESIEGKKYVDVSLKYNDGTKIKSNLNDPSNFKELNADFTTYDVQFPNSPKGKDENGVEQNWPLLTIDNDNGLKFVQCPEDKKEQIANVNKERKEKHIEQVAFTKSEGEYYNLTIQSKFLSTEDNTALVGKNIRKVQASYKILVPDYENALGINSSKIEPKDYAVLDRGITIGGNMDIKNLKDLTVRGDIFVQGTKPQTSNGDVEETKPQTSKVDKVYDKYSRGGITINNGSTGGTVNFLPEEGKKDTPVNVNTRGTFNIQNNSEVNIGSNDSNSIEGNLYAANIFAGDLTQDDKFAEDSKLNVSKDVVIDNDLTVTAKETEVNIGNFYGINDKNVKYAGDNDEIGKSSSSIIINGYKDPQGNGNVDTTVKILNEAYIMGTAHINTAEDYKTGESIAVKGNYTAYAVPVSPDEKFKYDSPLQVLDEDDVNKKADHFEKYWNGKGDNGIQVANGSPDYGGIILPEDPNKIHSVGAIVYKTLSGADAGKTIVRSTTNSKIEDEAQGGVIYNRKAEYANHVFKLGVNSSYGNDHDYYEDCESNGSNMDTVGDILDYHLTEDRLPSSYNWRTQLADAESKNNADGDGFAIFNPTNEPITIDKNMKAVIVTNGDVIINGGVTFKGNIIAKGNVTVGEDVISSKNVTIEYDLDAVKEIQAANPDVFEAVFGPFRKNKDDDNDLDDKMTLKQVLDAQYDIKKYIEKKLWKLIK